MKHPPDQEPEHFQCPRRLLCDPPKSKLPQRCCYSGSCHHRSVLPVTEFRWVQTAVPLCVWYFRLTCLAFDHGVCVRGFVFSVV